MIYLTVLVLIGVTLADSQGICRKHRVEREESKEPLEKMWPVRPILDCSRPGIDAALMTTDKKTYFFKGEYYWRLIGSEVAQGYPRLISQDWDGLPGNLDAALTWKDGRTFFFKGKLYWSFHGNRMDHDYPRNISEGFCGIPDNIDAAVLWKHNNLVYFFKGNQYWRFDGGESCTPVQSNYPLSIASQWKNIPGNLDAAIFWENGRTYFLKGENYYRYDDHGKDSDAGKPVKIHGNWGLNCQALACRIPWSPKMEYNSEDYLESQDHVQTGAEEKTVRP